MELDDVLNVLMYFLSNMVDDSVEAQTSLWNRVVTWAIDTHSHASDQTFTRSHARTVFTIASA